MAGLIDNMLNDKSKDQDGNKKDFVDKIEQREDERKKRQIKREHPYNYLKFFLVVFVILPLASTVATAIFVGGDKDPSTIKMFTTVYSFFIYIYSFYWMVAQEIINNVLFFLGRESWAIPLEVICYYPSVFENGEPIKTGMIFSISPFEFRDNLFANLDLVFSTLNEKPSQALRETFFLLLFGLAQSYGSLLLIYHVVKKIIVRKSVVPSSILVEKWAKMIKDPDKQEEAGKIKKQIFAQSKTDKRVYVRAAYKEFFSQIDPVGTAVMESALNKTITVKKDFYEQLGEIFNKNIPTKYYNIINFLSKDDFKLFHFEAKPFEDTNIMAPYTKKELAKYKSHFNTMNGHLMLPIMMARLRSYRTYDLHNVITYGKNNPEEFFLDGCSKEEIGKIQRIGKEGYKLFHNPNENQDVVRFSVELRYPFSFSIADIDKLEAKREEIKIMQRKLVLKYLSSDTNMHVYSIENGEINSEAYGYFNADYQKYINEVLSFNELFFETLKGSEKYSWVNDYEGEKLKDYMVQMIYLNFNPNLFLSELAELNASHFKSLYFVEEPISVENRDGVVALLDNVEVELNEYIGEHSPIGGMEFLSKQNLGYFRMLSIGQDMLGVISDENRINSFLDEFKIEYTRLK